MGEKSPLLQIKGIREGLLITLGQASWSDQVAAIIAQIESQPTFFQGARLTVDVGSQALRVAELSKLRDILSEHNISLWAVLSESLQTETTAQNLGLATRLAKPQPVNQQTAPDEFPAEAAKWIKGPLRSGARITHEGPVIVMGDVNPGAEIVASGSVVIWGRLRGVVHAGAGGDEQAIVCALELSPTQLRIAGDIAISPLKPGKKQPEVARIENGLIIAEPWQQ